MYPHPIWFIFSTLAFVFGIVALLTSGFVFYRIFATLSPLLGDTKDQIQDLGDLAANTVGRAADTMDLVEIRVSQTMGQANAAGKEATRQAMGLGSALAGLYLVARFAGMLRAGMHAARKPAKHRAWFRR